VIELTQVRASALVQVYAHGISGAPNPALELTWIPKSCQEFLQFHRAGNSTRL